MYGKKEEDEDEGELDEELILSLVQQELLKMKKEVMEGLKKEMKEMIFNDTMKSATPRIPLMKKAATLESITRALEGDISKVRMDVKELVDKLPDPKPHNNRNNHNNHTHTHTHTSESERHNEHPISLNVGGHLFETRMSTLKRYPATLLGMMASGHPFFSFDNHRPKGDRQAEPFFDRNSVAFEHVLEYYRTGALHRPPSLAPELWWQELDFWNIPHQHHDTTSSSSDGMSQSTGSLSGEDEKKKKPRKKRSQSAKGGRELWFETEKKRNRATLERNDHNTTTATSPTSTTSTTTTQQENNHKEEVEWRASMSPRWASDKAISKASYLGKGTNKQPTNSTESSSPASSSSSSSSSNSSSRNATNTKEKRAKRLSVQNIFSSKSAPILTSAGIEKEKKKKATSITRDSFSFNEGV